MNPGRRNFVGIAVTAAAALPGTCLASEDEADAQPGAANEQVGCLVDTTLCVGCRQCEEACSRRNKQPPPQDPPDGSSIFREIRRPDHQTFTVVNQYPGAPSVDQPQKTSTYVKTQCMHCLDPACVSACIVGALTRAKDGAVVYNPSICIGCRYCMVACPFQVPAYEYSTVLAPKVRKCEFCTEHEGGIGANPACAAACPTEAIVFGKRSDLLDLAKERIRSRPVRYVDHVYGEHEVGGTSWLYLFGRDKKEIGLLDLPHDAPPRLTEAIQHTIFKYGAIPFTVYGALGALMWHQRRRAVSEQEAQAKLERDSTNVEAEQ
jgi:Fe-S-cluster-containing dehydrogenase component